MNGRNPSPAGSNVAATLHDDVEARPAGRWQGTSGWVAAILILLIAHALGLGLVVYAMYVLMFTMIVSVWLTKKWSESMSATRECNRLEAEVGDVVAVVIELRNGGKLPVPWVLAEELLPSGAMVGKTPALKLAGERIILAHLKSDGMKRIMYQVRCQRRGYYQLGPLVLETGDLFGLHRKYRVVAKPLFLTVYPEALPLTGYSITSRRPIGEIVLSHRLFEDPTRMAGIRTYQPGDPLNRVHWRATARTGVLHSKIYEASVVAGTTLVLDFHHESYPASNEPVRSELAVTAAVTLAHAVSELRQQIGLVTNGRDAAERLRWENWEDDLETRADAHESGSMLTKSDRLRPLVVATRQSPDQFMKIREILARVELTDGIPVTELLMEATIHMPRDASVVVITSNVSERVAIALGNLKRQGYAVTIIINTHEDIDFADASGPLFAQGITAVHLRDHDAIASIAEAYLANRMDHLAGTGSGFVPFED